MRARQTIKRALLIVAVWTAFGVTVECGYRAYLYVFQDFPDDPSAFDLYGVGESTVMGEPYQAKFSLPSLVASELGGNAIVNGQKRPIRIRVLARQGESAYPQAMAFERAVAFRNAAIPGAVIIYAGHNERIPPEGQPVAPLNGMEKLERSFLVRHSWVARDLILYARSKRSIKTEYSLERYEYLLRRMVEDAKRAGLSPILYAPASNISGIEPNAPDDDKLQAILASGTYLQRTNQPSAAVNSYAAQMPNAPKGGDAILSYEIGKCEAQEQRPVDARQDFLRAIERDERTNFGRATVAQNDVVRRVAGDEHVDFVDAAAMFESSAPNRIPGNDLFSDGQHPNLNGYALLANEAAKLYGPAMRFHDGEDVRLRLHLSAADLALAHRGSGAWLLTTAVHHPWPVDRMTLAESHYRQALGNGDDFTDWAGVALAEAAMNGLLRDRDSIDLLTGLHVWYSPVIRVPAPEWVAFEAALVKFRADPDSIQQLRLLHEKSP